MTDRILKRLYPYLTRKITPSRLQTLGWQDFFNYDREDADDVVTICAEVFLYLSLEVDTGNWNGVHQILTSISSFLYDETRILVTREQAAGILDTMKKTPVPKDEVHTWFEKVYGPPSD